MATTEFQVSKPSPERRATEQDFTLRIFENPKRSGIVLSVDHNHIDAPHVRVNICNPGETPDDGVVKGWSFRGNEPNRKYRARLIDACIQLRGRAAIEFVGEIEHELQRGRAVFVNLLLKHKDGSRLVRFPITADTKMVRKRFNHNPDAGIHRGGKVVE